MTTQMTQTTHGDAAGVRMRAVVVRSPGGPAALEIVPVRVPVPGPGEVLIAVEATAVEPVDLATRSGALISAGVMAARDQIGIGWSVAGRVQEVGPGVTGLRPGDRVVGLRDRLDVSLGTYAEYVSLPEYAVVPAPPGVPAAAAATLPLGGLTAWQSLGLLGLQRGETLLVTGAAGGVGGYAVELAAQRKVRVVAQGRPEDEQVLRRMGAWRVVSRDADVAEAVREVVPGGVDACLDAAALGIAALGAVGNGGRWVAVTPGAAPLPLRGITVHTQWVAARAADLRSLVALAGAGRLTLRVHSVLPLHQAGEAHERFAAGVRGRIVLTP